MAHSTSLRSSFVLLGVGLSLLILLLVTALLISVHSMSVLSGGIRRSLQLDRAAMGLQVDLLRTARERELYSETGEERWRQGAREAEERLVNWLEFARALPKPPEVEETFSHLDRTIEELRREVLSAPPTQRPFRLSDFLEAETRVNAFLESIVNSAQSSVERADVWSRIALILAVASLIAVLLCLSFVGFFVRRGIYLPIVRLRRALEAHASDPRVRVPEEGAMELQAIGADVNVMIDRLAAQRERELTFLSGIAHDLRNPMTALQSAAQLAMRRSETEAQRQQATLVLRQVDRMNRLVEDLLDRSRIEAGQFELRLERGDLRDTIRDGCALYEDVSEIHQVRCAVPDEPVWAVFDAARLSQVLGNLVGNAIKYSPDGGPVDVRLISQDGLAVFEVRDEGLGIPDDDLATIFEPFQRTSGPAEKIPGVGLGLSVVRRLVRAHCGEIEVESEAGVGSTFRVLLPLGTE